MSKPTHVKPSFYALCFEDLKKIAFAYGYNLVLHGSLARDFDLIAIPWQKDLLDIDEMIAEMANAVDGYVMVQTDEQRNCFPHGRVSYVINIQRMKDGEDVEYYIDISVTPAIDWGLSQKLQQGIDQNL